MTREVIKKLQELDAYVTKMIASREGVKPENVSVRYIHEQREQHIYKTKRYDVGSSYGGYDVTGLKVLTGMELEAMEIRADKFLNSCV